MPDRALDRGSQQDARDGVGTPLAPAVLDVVTRANASCRGTIDEYGEVGPGAGLGRSEGARQRADVAFPGVGEQRERVPSPPLGNVASEGGKRRVAGRPGPAVVRRRPTAFGDERARQRSVPQTPNTGPTRHDGR